MKKLIATALTIALAGVCADAAFDDHAFLTFTVRELQMPADGVIGPPAIDPTGLSQLTIYLNDEVGKETNDTWTVKVTFTSSHPDRGIYNIKVFGGFVPVDKEEDALAFNNPSVPHSYNMEMDSWLAAGFDWLAPPIPHNID